MKSDKPNPDLPFAIHENGSIEVQDEFLKKFILSAQDNMVGAEMLSAINSPEVLMPAVEAIDEVLERGIEIGVWGAVEQFGVMDSVVEQMVAVVDSVESMNVDSLKKK